MRRGPCRYGGGANVRHQGTGRDEDWDQDSSGAQAPLSHIAPFTWATSALSEL